MKIKLVIVVVLALMLPASIRAAQVTLDGAKDAADQNLEENRRGVERRRPALDQRQAEIDAEFAERERRLEAERAERARREAEARAERERAARAARASQPTTHYSCYSLPDEAREVCLGNCYAARDDKIRELCLGNCFHRTNTAEREACHGNCAFVDDPQARDACYTCGGGHRWTTLYYGYRVCETCTQ